MQHGFRPSSEEAQHAPAPTPSGYPVAPGQLHGQAPTSSYRPPQHQQPPPPSQPHHQYHHSQTYRQPPYLSSHQPHPQGPPATIPPALPPPQQQQQHHSQHSISSSSGGPPPSIYQRQPPPAHLPPQHHPIHHPHQPRSQHDSQYQPMHHGGTPLPSVMQTGPLQMAPGQPLRAEEHHQMDEGALIPISRGDEFTGRKYRLDVAQQPIRARMCGFGDKDRRPVTPPPCVRLIITDLMTGKEIDTSSIDHTMFVLNVDLWNEKAAREVNLVRCHQADAASSYNGQHAISSIPTRDGSYPPQAAGYMHDYPVSSGYNQTPPSYTQNGSYGPPTQYFPQHQTFKHEHGTSTPGGISSYGAANGMLSQAYMQEQPSLTRSSNSANGTHGMFTRNLIGSLSASAFRLSDTDDRMGIWFVLQDLSVRTEGNFRLRFTFTDVSPRNGQSRDDDALKVTTGRAPILASVFTDVFTVFSAKKFPGVCESTPLSKTFATQGIKIPIRKDAKPGEEGNEDD